MVDPDELPQLRRFKLGADGKPVGQSHTTAMDEPYEGQTYPSRAAAGPPSNAAAETLLVPTVPGTLDPKTITPPPARQTSPHPGGQSPPFSVAGYRDSSSARPNSSTAPPKVSTEAQSDGHPRRWIIPAAIVSLLIIAGVVLVLVRPWQTDSSQRSDASATSGPSAATASPPTREANPTSTQSQSAASPAQWATDVCGPIRAYASIAATTTSQLTDINAQDNKKVLAIKSTAQSGLAALANALKMVTSAAGSNDLAAAQTTVIKATDEATKILAPPITEVSALKAAIIAPIAAFDGAVAALPPTLKVIVASNEVCQSVSS